MDDMLEMDSTINMLIADPQVHDPTSVVYRVSF